MELTLSPLCYNLVIDTSEPVGIRSFPMGQFLLGPARSVVLDRSMVYHEPQVRSERRMGLGASECGRVWTVSEAKAKLSEILRLAETEGPQRIGIRKPFIVVPKAAWEEKSPRRMPLGQWLVENMPRGTNLEPPGRGGDSRRRVPFADRADDYGTEE